MNKATTIDGLQHHNVNLLILLIPQMDLLNIGRSKCNTFPYIK